MEAPEPSFAFSAANGRNKWLHFHAEGSQGATRQVRLSWNFQTPTALRASFLAAERETTLTTQCTKSLLKKELLGVRHFDSVERTGCFCPVVLGLGNNCQTSYKLSLMLSATVRSSEAPSSVILHVCPRPPC
uniref:Uncharacterized protein n=1 Tax=Myotis myotis TaxID=51298 RepID=A0A7J7WI05_MYOMY|nr:hypothetical protein mMyoMyo1_012150 [Myotis myotis]